MTMATVPEEYLDLLERPAFAHLATTRPDGSPQVNPMWFTWDGTHIRFTHTDERQKFRNLAANPHVAIAISDPDNPYRYLELRGVVENVVSDPTGAFYVELAVRYGRDTGKPPRDAPHRVILEVAITHTTSMG
jgi:PPOX class probable F420-dependent enzyme